MDEWEGCELFVLAMFYSVFMQDADDEKKAEFEKVMKKVLEQKENRPD